MTAELQLVVRSGHPDFLDLPWSEPLEEWHSERLVRMARGISRHVVRFVAYDDRVYTLKETEAGAAEREYRLLLALGSPPSSRSGWRAGAIVEPEFAPVDEISARRRRRQPFVARSGPRWQGSAYWPRRASRQARG